MKKLFCSVALVAAAFLINSTNVHAQVVRGNMYRSTLVRPAPPLRNVRVATPNFSLGVYSNPNYYRYPTYPYANGNYYPYSSYYYPNVATPIYSPYVTPSGLNFYFGNMYPY